MVFKKNKGLFDGTDADTNKVLNSVAPRSVVGVLLSKVGPKCHLFLPQPGHSVFECLDGTLWPQYSALS